MHLGDLISWTKTYTLRINEEEILFPPFSGWISRNGLEVLENSPYQTGDTFEITPPNEPTVGQIAENLRIKLYEDMVVLFNDEKISLQKRKYEFYKEENLLDIESILHHNDVITMKEIKNEPFIFQDIFRFVNIDIPQGITGGFKLLKNEQEVTFYDPLVPGDRLNIVWPTTVS
jgi:hypothetical protein